MGHIKAGQSATLAIHSTPSSPAQLQPLGASDAQPLQAAAGAAPADGASRCSIATPAPAPAAPAQISEAGSGGGGDSGKRHPGGAADSDARHPKSQADTSYRIRQLAASTAAVSFAEPLSAAEPEAVSTEAVTAAGIGFASSTCEAAADIIAGDAAADAELPEESAWLLERQREREREAVPWLRSSSEQFSLSEQFPAAAAAAPEQPVTPPARPGLPAAGASDPVAIPGRASGGGALGRELSAGRIGCVGRTGSAPSLLGTSPVNARKVPGQSAAPANCGVVLFRHLPAVQQNAVAGGWLCDCHPEGLSC